ncbi:MAG: glycosyltransferase family 2 protein [Clostridia bacterium]|nr:glycosyltransferase family 2 protein [Clostridia bacterium]
MINMVSVIIPVYNVETLLRKCVDSVLNQTYSDIEVFLIDDGSTDSSPHICDEYAASDSRVKALHQENAGQAIARNNALDVAVGDYVMFVDSDDWIKSDMIETMVDSAQRHNASVVICSASFDNGNKIADAICPYGSEQVFTGAQVLEEYLTPGRIQTAPWGKLFRRELFDEIRFPPYRAREDYAIMHELLGGSETAVYIPKHVYVQYVRPGSTEYSRFNENKLAVIECDLAIMDYVKKYYPHLYYKVETNYADALRNCMADICRSFVKRRYKKTFLSLKERLKAEIKRLQAEGCKMPLDSHCFAVYHPIVFSLREHFTGIVRWGKRMVKTIIGKKE